MALKVKKYVTVIWLGQQAKAVAEYRVRSGFDQFIRRRLLGAHS